MGCPWIFCGEGGGMQTRSFSGFIDCLNEWVGYVISFLILPMTLISVMEVVLRYVFNRPTIWGWDVNVMLLGAFSVLTGGYVLLKEGHVTMDVFVSRASPRVRAVIALTTSLLFFFCIGLLVWQGGLEARDSIVIREKVNSVWGPPLYPLKILWPIGAILLLLQGVANFMRDLKTARSKEAKDG
jgi:TRAP-type mannitol/chloroaromatic compound transport system permease small subunit